MGQTKSGSKKCPGRRSSNGAKQRARAWVTEHRATPQQITGILTAGQNKPPTSPASDQTHAT